ncbi:hypothetical protein BS47DRAFT_1367555 [Hydnum rufescens UP504]|uniref:Uncharacterized protein n=1 Tax=Hydnum rufescens UP504 TaxID=1448309 RepID=A0A9P6AII2_9AGAM|nr:hypothetical protein BS47DRAFT_1367555 [Hydnum rufescens UP504]
MSAQRTRSGGWPSDVLQGRSKKISTKTTKSMTSTLKKTTNTPACTEESPPSEHNMHADGLPAAAVRQAPKTLRKYGSKYKHEATTSKSLAAQGEELAGSNSDVDADTNILPAAVAQKLPKKVGGNARRPTSHAEQLSLADSDVDGDSAPNARHHLRMVVKIPHLSSSNMGLPIHKPPPTILSHQSIPHMSLVSSIAHRSSPVAAQTSPNLPTIPSRQYIPHVSPVSSITHRSLPVTAQTSPHLSHAEQNDEQGSANAGSDSEDYHSGWFTNDQITWVQSKCLDFFWELDAKAREWKWSLESVR